MAKDVPISNYQNIFDHIDSLQDIDSIKNACSSFDDNNLKKIFWQSFKKYFASKSDLEKQKKQA